MSFTKIHHVFFMVLDCFKLFSTSKQDVLNSFFISLLHVSTNYNKSDNIILVICFIWWDFSTIRILKKIPGTKNYKHLFGIYIMLIIANKGFKPVFCTFFQMHYIIHLLHYYSSDSKGWEKLFVKKQVT